MASAPASTTINVPHTLTYGGAGDADITGSHEVKISATPFAPVRNNLVFLKSEE